MSFFEKIYVMRIENRSLQLWRRGVETKSPLMDWLSDWFAHHRMLISRWCLFPNDQFFDCGDKPHVRWNVLVKKSSCKSLIVFAIHFPQHHILICVSSRAFNSSPHNSLLQLTTLYDSRSACFMGNQKGGFIRLLNIKPYTENHCSFL